jgi:hypothetical protein
MGEVSGPIIAIALVLCAMFVPMAFLTGVTGQLRTLESNARQTSERQYQFTTDGTVPESQLQQFRKEMQESSDRTLMLADAAMFRQSQTRKRGERGLPVTLGIFMSEGRKLPSLMDGAPQSGSFRKSVRSARKR